MGGIVGGAIGAIGSIFGADKAADAQQQTAAMQIKAQKEMFEKSQALTAPYREGGQNFLNMLLGRIGGLTEEFLPTMEQLEQTPGYQWNLNQGLKATQNAYAARGLGTSGAALKGAADYASGLASNTYQQQLSNYLTQNAQTYNMLMGGAQMGANAATGSAGQAMQLGQGISGALGTAGAAQANAYNTMGGAIANLGNTIGGMAMANGNWGLGSGFGLGGSSGNGLLGDIGSSGQFVQSAYDPWAGIR